MSSVLVVGGAGFIGSHCAKALKEKGYTPVVYDNLKNGHEWAVKWGPLVVGDLLDDISLDLAFKTYRPSVVLHFASSINVRESMQNPGLYYQNNVVGSLRLFEAMKRNGVPFLVFSSSAAVYGEAGDGPISEDALCNPTHVYGKSKWMVEQIIADYQRAHGFRSVIFRYFNAAGADLSGELGEAHDPETHLIPLALQAACRQREHLEIFGVDHPTFDGSPIRDYVHVTDLANAHVLGVERLLSQGSSVTLNLGTGKGHSLNEVLSMVKKVTEKNIQRKILPRNIGEPAALVACPQKANSILGWTPQHSDLETIVATAHHWLHPCSLRSSFRL